MEAQKLTVNILIYLFIYPFIHSFIYLFFKTNDLFKSMDFSTSLLNTWQLQTRAQEPLVIVRYLINVLTKQLEEAIYHNNQ